MAYTALEIANSALLKVGARPITSFADDLPEARAVNARYAQVINSVIAMYPFSCALKRERLAPHPTQTPAYGYDYQFALPNDCLKVWEVVDANGDRIYDFVREGRYIMANIAVILIRYTYNIVAAGVMDHDVAEMLSYYLAAEVSDRIDPDKARTSELRQLAEMWFAKVRTIDARTSAPRFYGAHDPFDKLQNDAPTTWLDTRL